MRRGVLIVAFVVCAANSFAADGVLLRMKPATGDPVLVGERLVISIDLLTATTFASAPAFELPVIPGAVLMKLEDRPVLGSEAIDDVTYTVQTHELWFFALRAAEFSVPAFQVRFATPPEFGKPPVDREVESTPLTITANMPAGTSALPTILCAKDFSATETWVPTPGDSVHVGDSFKRTITLTASDVPAMIFPPIPSPTIDGLKQYAGPPAVEDKSERGTFQGRRVDTVAYVCERAGEFPIPQLVIPWWNLESQSLEQITLPGVTFKVQPAVQKAEATPINDSGNSRTWWGLGGLIVAAALGAAWTLRELAARWRELRSSSEPVRFAALIRACRTNDPQRACRELYSWLDSQDGGTSAADAIGSDALLATEIVSLETAATSPKGRWNGAALARALKSWRKARHGTRSRSARSSLPLLNPAADRQ